jgi:ABC-type branched-subunit amino acid transport system ATPase component
MALLEVKGVTKMFGALQALGGVDLSVQAGTFHGLIGPNGWQEHAAQSHRRRPLSKQRCYYF